MLLLLLVLLLLGLLLLLLPLLPLVGVEAAGMDAGGTTEAEVPALTHRGVG